MFAFGKNVGIPWMNELDKHVKGNAYILMNEEAAKARGIKAGYEVWVESEVGRVKREVKLCQGTRPDCVLIVGQFGQWTVPVAKDTHRVTLTSLVPMRYSYSDGMLGNMQSLVVKVKIYKAKGGKKK